MMLIFTVTWTFCCSKINELPQIVYPDREFIPVTETKLFGVTVSNFGKDLVMASSQNAIYMFSTESLHITPIAHISFNTSTNDSYVKVKAKNYTILLSVAGSLVIQKHNNDNLTSTISSFSPRVYITNCNHSMRETPEHCSGDNQWSSLESVGREFAYDGTDIIAISGRHPNESYAVVAVFKNDGNWWRLHQVLGGEEIDFTIPYSIALNQQFMVIAGSEICVYSKTLNSIWKKEETISEILPKSFFEYKNRVFDE